MIKPMRSIDETLSCVEFPHCHGTSQDPIHSQSADRPIIHLMKLHNQEEISYLGNIK